VASLLNAVAGLASPWGYVVVGLLTLLEAAAFVGLVVPGETALLVGGFLASQHRASLPLMMLAGAIGAIVGDSVGYEVGRRLGPSLRRSRMGRWVGEQRWARAEAYLNQRGGQAVFFGRFVGVLRALVPTIAGLSGMPYRTFLPWNAAGGLCWAPGFVLIGYAAGGSYHTVARWAGRASAVLVVLVGLVVAVILAVQAVVKREAAVRGWFRGQAERPAVARARARYERQLAFMARRVRPHGATGLSMTAGMVALVGLGWVFGAVVREVVARDPAAGVDGRFYGFFLDHRAPALSTGARFFTQLGGDPVLLIVTVAVAGAVAWRSRRTRDLVIPLVALVGSVVLQEVVKLAVRRDRPPVAQMLATGSGFAFPSAHATRAAACYLAVALVLSGRLGSWRAKVTVAAGGVTLALLVGVSRLALGVHWLTDVVAGWTLGTLWFVVVLIGAQVAAAHTPHRSVPPRDKVRT